MTVHALGQASAFALAIFMAALPLTAARAQQPILGVGTRAVQNRTLRTKREPSLVVSRDFRGSASDPSG